MSLAACLLCGFTQLRAHERMVAVVVLFRAAPNAPILRRDRVRMDSNQQFVAVGNYLRRQLQLSETDSLVSWCCLCSFLHH